MSKTITQTDLDRIAGMSSRDGAKLLGVGKSTVNDARERARINGGKLPNRSQLLVGAPPEGNGPRVAFFDIETKPAIVATFNLFKPVLGPQNIISDPDILCFTYNWEGEPVQFVGQDEFSYDEVLDRLHALLDQADILVGYNSRSFDVKWIEGELLIAGYAPPSEFKQIDLYRELKKRSRLISGKLEYAATRFLDDHKVSHAGMSLWLGCMENDPASWETMRTYAIQDTALMEPLYRVLAPWITSHPNRSSFYDGEQQIVCTRCESGNIQRQGTRRTAARKQQRFQCQDCGGWFYVATGSAALSPLRSA